MSLLDYFAPAAVRRAAREEAAHAIRVKGAAATQELRDRMLRTESRKRRQVYRLAIKVLPELMGRQ